MSMLSTVSVVGQIVLGGFFVLASLNMVFDAEREAAWASAKGIPFASAVVYLAAAGWLVGGAAVVADPFVGADTLVVGVPILVVLLLVVTPTMHDFWNLEEQDGLQTVAAADGGETPLLPPQTSESMTFLSNVAIAGALLALL